ncbi:hypothetical protein LRS10_22340 [Phenylobacterium sp. J426]|uniref:LPD7 domain-containing protein n=1 Tax=Phenylobacterium sp. J426 TaxID=2898439 RepID=UPI0021511A04|nr:LPD7 domain-containing protein [Phenylobacterium sp. J426]MCR5876648.1 hypothetical protein [Phenylobacterium sp. J426]
MADSPLNRIDAAAGAPGTAGDVPERVRRRYLVERDGRDRVAFFADATIRTPAFRDEGRRLLAHRNDPRLVRDLVAIAKHRNWRQIEVRGETAFRRQVWLTARQTGLEVRGYRPTKRDEQDLQRRRQPKTTPELTAPPERSQAVGDSEARMRIVRAVVQAFVRPPERQAAILATAERRLRPAAERTPSPSIVEPVRHRAR